MNGIGGDAKNITIPFSWSATERGNILLDDSEGGFNAWMRLPGDNLWLETTYRPSNYPSVNVGVIEATDKKLAAHINAECKGMRICKCNIEGVTQEPFNEGQFIVKISE